MPDYDRYLDAKGLNCPLPVLKAKLELNRMAAGTVLYVEATDSHAEIDFRAYCARSGHELVRSEEDAGVIRFYIRRAEQPEKV